MGRSQRMATAKHRERQRRKGLVRVELQVPGDDVGTLRSLAEVLRGDGGAAVERVRDALVRAVAEVGGAPSAKQVLAAMPEDIILERRSERPRPVEL